MDRSVGPAGFALAAVFPDRFLALLAAAVLPGTSRDRLLRLNGEEDAGGFPVQFNDVSLVRSPQSLAKE